MPKWHHCPTRRVLLARLRGGFSSFAAHNSANCTRRGIQSGPPGTYYNSQLGAWIRKSGAAGIRIHDVSLARIRAQEWASHGALLLPRLLRLHPASIDLGSFSQGAQLRPQCAAPVFAKGPVLEQAEQLRAALQGNAPHAAEGDGSWPASTLFSVLASTASELDEWAGVDAIGPEQKMVTIPVSILQEQSRALDTVLALVHTTKEAGMQVKIRLTDAFADSYLLQDIVLAVADHGADVVIVEGNGDEEADDVRDDLEALLGLDVSGESMMERLGFRGNLSCTMMAANIGITHFEAEAAAAAHTPFATAAQTAQAVADQGKSLGHFDIAGAHDLARG